MSTTRQSRRIPESVSRSFAIAAVAGMGCATLVPQLVHAQAGALGYQPAEWEKIVAAAKKEGRVAVYYSAVTPVLERIKAGFEKAYPGIVLEYSRLNAGVPAKVEAERSTGADGADANLDSSAIIWTLGLAKAGVLKKPVGPASRTFPAAYLLEGAAPVLAMEPITIAYNTTLIKTPINGYQDLLKPELKGRIATTELLGPTLVAWYEWLEKTQGADFLPKLAAQNPKYYTGAAITTQAALSGEMSIAAFSNPTTTMPLIAKGAPLKMVLPTPTFGIRYTGTVFSWAKRPNAAMVLQDWLMSPPGQIAWNGGGESASPLPNIPGALDAKLVTPYDPAPYTPEVVAAYTKKWNAIFKGQQ